MDTVADSLSKAWKKGNKTLVFVRRVASVKELKRKVDESYDDWLIGRLRNELPLRLSQPFEHIVDRFRAEKLRALQHGTTSREETLDGPRETEDRGGNDTFFAWFFRGEGPANLISGANVQQRFGQPSSAYSLFFQDNYVALALGCRPSETTEQFAKHLKMSVPAMKEELEQRACRFLSRAKKPPRADRFEAVQAAAIEWLKDTPGIHQRLANVIWHERFVLSQRPQHTDQPPDSADFLNLRSFFTDLRQRPELRERIWPECGLNDTNATVENIRESFREQELRRQTVTSAARLGHAFIDLYLLVMRRIGSFKQRARETSDDDSRNAEVDLIEEYLALLETQRMRPGERDWQAFDELAQLGAQFDLILDVTDPEIRRKPLSETARIFGQLFGRQQPVGGMSGTINRTLVRQFRLPGYPLILITTELLQEGEDLHTFCSSIQHYGISWTPSSMEQRIGRIDRVRSETDRRLSKLSREPSGDEKLQIFFPHLQDTVELLQVRRVLNRMDTFLRMVHENLGTPDCEGNRKINLAREALATNTVSAPQTVPLRTAFGVRESDLKGEVTALAVSPEYTTVAEERFLNLRNSTLPGLKIVWESEAPRGMILGTVLLATRQQPFTLILQSYGERLLLRCISPIGCVSPETTQDSVLNSVTGGTRIGAIVTNLPRTYDLTVEEDVLLASDPATDTDRLAMLLRCVTEEADRLEQELLPGRDEPLRTFRRELEKELLREE